MKSRLFRILWAVVLTFALALFPFGPAQFLPTLHLGFPSRFFTVHCTAGEFALSFHIGAFAVNVIVFYALLTLADYLCRKFQKP